MTGTLGLLGLATAVFAITHIGFSSTPLRAAIVKGIGEWMFLAFYSLIAALTLGWMVFAYTQAPHLPLWIPGFLLRHVPLVVMPFAVIFLVASLTVKNPTAVGMENSVRREDPARGILRITRHPLQWAILLWAVAHILANGDLATVIFFGGFLVLAAAGPFLIDRKRRLALGPDWIRFAGLTSNVPFAAILAGRNRLRLAEIGAWRIVLGLVLYAVLIASHRFVFGVAPY